MERRGFMAAILAAGMAPAIVRAENIMRVVPRGWRVSNGGVLTPGKYYIEVNFGPDFRYGPPTGYEPHWQRGPIVSVAIDGL